MTENPNIPTEAELKAEIYEIAQTADTHATRLRALQTLMDFAEPPKDDTEATMHAIRDALSSP